jgi:hypothetical protein
VKPDQLTKNQLKSLNEIDSLMIYHNVKFMFNSLNDNCVAYAMKLDIPKGKINWEYSKRLMFGSLVCLSSDFFRTNCLIGLICERDKEQIKNNTITIKFDLSDEYSLEADEASLLDEYDNPVAKASITMNSNLPNLNDTYTLIETSAYFESYKHVLESFVFFKRAGEEAFPFKEHFVYAKNEAIEMPEYLKQAYIDFR